mgnify:CR=1 FL=1
MKASVTQLLAYMVLAAIIVATGFGAMGPAGMLF